MGTGQDLLGAGGGDLIFRAAPGQLYLIETSSAGVLLAPPISLLNANGSAAAIDGATFGDVSRKIDEGRGIEGIVETEAGYLNPLSELMGQAVHA